jgi:hypothetical protein
MVLGWFFMPEFIFKCLFAVLAVIGAVEVFRMILLRVLRTDHPGRLLLTLTFSGHDEQAELRLRNALERAAWMPGGVQVACIDKGMDEETRAILEMICVDNPGVILCTPEEFVEFWID